MCWIRGEKGLKLEVRGDRDKELFLILTDQMAKKGKLGGRGGGGLAANPILSATNVVQEKFTHPDNRKNTNCFSK